MTAPEKSHRRSIIEIIRLPETFGVVLLTGSLVLLLSPYMSGADFGIFKVPIFPSETARILRAVGPAAFLLALFLFLPVWKSAVESAEVPEAEQPAADAIRKVPGGFRVQVRAQAAVPELVGRAFARYGEQGWQPKSFVDQLATVVAELALNAFEHGGASWVDIGVYEQSVVLHDDGTAFNPLQFRGKAKATGGAGLFSLNHLLEHANPRLAPDYRDLRKKSRGGVINEFILYVLRVETPGARSSEMFNVTLRGRVDLNDVSEANLAHIVSLEWGFRHYVLDQAAIDKQLYRGPRIVSRDGNLVEMLVMRIPTDAVLHLKGPKGEMRGDYYRELASRYGGRIIVD
jgi:hypothetical protein